MTKYNGKNRTIDCEPTLNDSQVLEFCKNGYLILENVVPNEINKKTIDYLNGKTPSNPEYIPDGLSEKDLDSIRHSNEPSTLILEKWFREKLKHIEGLKKIHGSGWWRHYNFPNDSLPISVEDMDDIIVQGNIQSNKQILEKRFGEGDK